MTDEVEFKEWFDQFHKTNTGFEPPKEWPTEVNKSKDKIRKLLGGVRKIMPIELENSYTPCDYSIIKDKVEQLQKLIPNYFSYYNLTTADMQYPLLQRTKFSGMAWPKHMKFWINMNNVPVGTQVSVRKIISELGDIWVTLKTQKQIMYANMTTDPKAFAYIGHYGPDTGSCFRQTKINQIHKYILGLEPESFVFLIQSSPDEELEAAKKGNTLCRSWGMPNKDLSVFHLGNYYPLANVSEANLHASIERFFGDFFGIKRAKHFENNYTITGELYHNTNFRWSLCKPTPSISPHEFRVVKSGCLVGLIKCATCDNQISNNSAKMAFNQTYKFCEDCFNKLPICDWNHERWYGGGVTSAIGRDGNRIRINPYFITSGTFVQSRYSNFYYHKDDCIKTDSGYFIGIKELKSYGYEKCKDCDFAISISSKGNCSRCNLANSFVKIKEKATLNPVF